MNSNYYLVIMAGGVGSRFWPVSSRSEEHTSELQSRI